LEVVDDQGGPGHSRATPLRERSRRPTPPDVGPAQGRPRHLLSPQRRCHWSQEHIGELAWIGHDYDVELDPEPHDHSSFLAKLRQKVSEIVGRQHAPGLLMLADLRRMHRMAAGVSLDWEILAQTAQALKDRELLALSQRCHPQTLRQLRWSNALLKENAAQTMVTP